MLPSRTKRIKNTRLCYIHSKVCNTTANTVLLLKKSNINFDGEPQDRPQNLSILLLFYYGLEIETMEPKAPKVIFTDRI